MQFGVIKWIGDLPDKTEIFAGLEMVRHDRKSLTLFCAMFYYHTASFLNPRCMAGTYLVSLNRFFLCNWYVYLCVSAPGVINN